MEKLIKFIILNLIKNKKEFFLQKNILENGYENYLVKISPEDMGRVIGRNGQIIKAIRNLLKIKALLEGKKVNLTLKD